MDLVVVRMRRAGIWMILEIFELLGEGQQETHDEIVQRVFAACGG